MLKNSFFEVSLRKLTADSQSVGKSIDDYLNKLADRLEILFPLSRTSVQVRDLLDQEEAKQSVVMCGFSGGADSLFLLLWLKAHYPKLASRAVALYFDHRTRPRQNEKETDFAGAVASQLGYQLRQGAAEGSPSRTEEELRDVRFKFFEDEMERASASVLLLGHHADDMAETFLLRAARGSGPDGLSAPRPINTHTGKVDHRRVRPLLNLSAEEIRGFLTEEEIPFIEDPSNRSDRYARNRIRNAVMPIWKGASDRDLLLGVGRSRMQLEEITDLLNALAEKYFPFGFGESTLTENSKTIPTAVLRHGLQQWIGHHGLSVSATLADCILEAAQSEENGKFSVGSGKWVCLEKGSVKYTERLVGSDWDWVGFSPESTLFFPNGSSLTCRLVDADPSILREISCGNVDRRTRAYLSITNGEFSGMAVRLWMDGDRYHPLGAPGSKNVADCLAERRVEREVRVTLPVVTFSGDIVWVPGLEPSDKHRVSGSTERLLSLTYQSA